MCAVSMIYDQYEDRFEHVWRWPAPPLKFPVPPISDNLSPADVGALRKLAAEAADLRALIEAFRTDLAAARAKDVADGAPDCHDPAKAKLEERVAALEKRLDALGL